MCMLREGQYDAWDMCPTMIGMDMEKFVHFLYSAGALASVPPL